MLILIEINKNHLIGPNHSYVKLVSLKNSITQYQKYSLLISKSFPDDYFYENSLDEQINLILIIRIINRFYSK